MNQFKRIICTMVATVMMVSVPLNMSYAATSSALDQLENSPKYIFLFIGDGMGMPQRSLAEVYKNVVLKDSKTLAMHSFPVAADISTHASNTEITDSAAAATALSSGYKTYNGAIGMNDDFTSQPTIMEAFIKKGFATGLITSTRMTHATPASFASHQDSRNKENSIAEDYLASNVDLLLGGGYRHFVGIDNTQGYKSKRSDDGLLTTFENKGYQVFLGEKDTLDFLKADLTQEDKVLGLFAYSHIPYVIDRDELKSDSIEYPGLDDMTAQGIDFLYNKGKESGFFVMVEGGRIDHAAHANDPLGVIGETLEFDKAIEEALSFYRKYPEDTLIIVTADHETGGLTLGGRLGDYDASGKATQEYKLNLEALVGNHSIEDVVGYKFAGDFNKNRGKFLTYLKDDYGLGALSQKELGVLTQAMDEESDDDENNDKGYYYSKTALAVSKIVALRGNIGWTTEIHTGVRIPLSAIGAGANVFNGYYDNAQVPIRIAKLVGIADALAYTHDDSGDIYQGTAADYHMHEEATIYRAE